MRSAKLLKKLNLAIPPRQTPISNLLSASGTFQDGDLVLNQKGLRFISEEMESQTSDAKDFDTDFSLADLETIKVIGKGSGGVVELVRHKWTGKLYALKFPGPAGRAFHGIAFPFRPIGQHQISKAVLVNDDKSRVGIQPSLIATASSIF